MKIEDLKAGSMVTLSFNLNNKHFNFDSEILYSEKGIHIKPVCIRGLVLHIRNDVCGKIKLTYYNSGSGRTHYWNDVKINCINDEYYDAECEEDSHQINRRDAVRIPIGIETDCVISDIKGKVPCTIMDLSITGVAIGMDFDAEEHNLLHREISFELIDASNSFNITATCVHVTKLSDTRYKCGCMINKAKPSINYYINQKQTRKLGKYINHQSISA